MLIVGLTGGIGTGKTTVAQLFARLDVPVIDADIIAHELLFKNKNAYQLAVEHFGQKILQTNGEIDRAKLRDIVFKQNHERTWLENVLHPLIKKEMLRQIKKHQTPYCIAVIPLLIEKGPIDFVDRILVVDAPLKMQLARVKTRSRISEENIRKIIEIQATRENRIGKAHDVILNEGKIHDLKQKVDDLHQKYTQLGLQKKPT